jgi:UDP-GlcNAc:undecaprenyl-phosphate/decaprenyl-phosphate GlcNAc-1-phosphate transferase
VFDLVTLVTSAGVTFFAALLLLDVRRPSAINHRGVRLPTVLGVAVAMGMIATIAGVLLGDVAAGAPVVAGEDQGWALGGALLVFGAGLFDDLRTARTRGVIDQLRLLGEGTVTSGVVKLVAAVAAAMMVSLAGEEPGVRAAVGIPLMAGAANLWNLLDVAPGRSLKFFIPAAIALVTVVPHPRDPLVPAALGSSLGIFPLDLRERAMLGDSGANLLGFVIGVGLFRAAPTWVLASALGIVLVLHVLAETVTLSRLIRAAPPLRWFDDLGRIPVEAGSTPGPAGPGSIKSRGA